MQEGQHLWYKMTERQSGFPPLSVLACAKRWSKAPLNVRQCVLSFRGLDGYGYMLSCETGGTGCVDGTVSRRGKSCTSISVFFIVCQHPLAPAARLKQIKVD